MRTHQECDGTRRLLRGPHRRPTDSPTRARGEGPGVRHVRAIAGHEHALLRESPIGGIVDTDDRHLVVAEQIPTDRLPERQTMEHRSELGLVIHRGQLEVDFASFPTNPIGEEPRCGGREQSPPRPNERAVESRGEPRRNRTGDPVGLIGDYEVKLWNLVGSLGLGNLTPTTDKSRRRQADHLLAKSWQSRQGQL